MAGDGRPVRRGRAEQRERLLRTAAQLFAENGYHGTGVAELGRAVNLGRGGLYHHMGTKEQLLVEISVRHVREMVEVGEQILAGDLPPPEKLRALSRRLMRTISERLPEVTVFFHEVNSLGPAAREEVLERRDRFEAIWQQVLDDGVQRGFFRAGGPLVTKGLLGMHNYSYMWIDPAGSLAPEEIADVFCDLVLRGLLTDAALETFRPVSGQARRRRSPNR